MQAKKACLPAKTFVAWNLPKQMPSRKKHLKADVQFEKIRATIRLQSNVDVGIRNYRAKTDPSLLFRTARKFATHPAYRRIVLSSPFPASFSDLPKRGFPYLVGYQRELAWAASLISEYSAKISAFIEAKDAVERSFLDGDFTATTLLLKDVEDRFGQSLWLVENRINLAQISDGVAAKNRLVRAISSEGGPSFIHYLVSWYSYRAGADVSRSVFDRFLDDETPLDFGLPYLVHVLNGHFPHIGYTEAGDMLSYTDNLPMIDRYEILLLTLQALATSADPGEPRDFTLMTLRTLSESITDQRLKRLVLAFGGTVEIIEPNGALLGLLNSYTLCEYAAVVRTISEGGYRLDDVDKIHLGIRSALFDDTDPEFLDNISAIRGIGGQISSDLRLTTNFSDSAVEARLRLQKIALTFCNSGWASSLALILARQLNDERAFPPTTEQIVHALRAASDHPLIAFAMPTKESTESYLLAMLRSNPSSPAILGVARLTGIEDSAPVKFELLGERRGRFEALQQARSGHILEAIALLETIVVSQAPSTVLLEATMTLVKLNLAAGYISAAADIIGRLFVSSRYFGIIVPIRELTDKLLEFHNEPFDASPTRGRISVAIAFDIYSRYISSNRDAERADAYKDVLKRTAITHASELVLRANEFSTDELIYFLRYVCIPDVLDQSLALRSSRDVEDERVAILVAVSELILSSGKAPPEGLKDELRDIRTRQVVRDTTLRLDQSKIYVNVDAIRRAVDVQMRENWNRYQLMLNGNEESAFRDIARIVRSALGDQITLIQLNAPLSERQTLFRRMVAELRDNFTSNKEFGLNSNLSANIRHGYVLRELRGPLVGRNLITNKDSESGSYHDNSHWLERLSIDEDLQRSELSDILALFSARIDNHIDRLNRHLLRIRSESNPDGLFNYSLSEMALEAVSRKWGKLQTYEEFIDAAFASFWDTTERNLNRVRATLQGSVLAELIEVINLLEVDIRASTIGARLPSLDTSITMVKTEIRDAIERVSSWFTLSGNNEYQDFDLEISYQAGLQTVKTYYKNLSIKAQYSANRPLIMLGWCLPMFARLFFLILDNAAMHGGHERDSLIVNVRAEQNDGSLFLSVANDLGPNHDLSKLQARVAEINGEYGQERAIELIGEEGGSGYPKIWKVLKTDLNRTHALSAYLSDNFFVVDIMMNTEGIL